MNDNNRNKNKTSADRRDRMPKSIRAAVLARLRELKDPRPPIEDDDADQAPWLEETDPMPWSYVTDEPKQPDEVTRSDAGAQVDQSYDGTADDWPLDPDASEPEHLYSTLAVLSELARSGPSAAFGTISGPVNHVAIRNKVLRHCLDAHEHARLNLINVTADMIEKLEQIARYYPNFGEACDAIIGAARLAFNSRTPLRLPPLLFIGPSGLGKSAYARGIADILTTTQVEFWMGRIQGPEILCGSSIHSQAPSPGLVAHSLLQQRSSAISVILEQLDKAPFVQAHKCLNVLEELFDPQSSARFVDAYFGFPIRADHIIWLATARNKLGVSAAIYDRCLAFEIEPLTNAQNRQVIRTIAAEEAGSSMCYVQTLDDSCVDYLVDERSLRRLRQTIRLAFGVAELRGRPVVSIDDVDRAEELNIKIDPIEIVRPRPD